LGLPSKLIKTYNHGKNLYSNTSNVSFIPYGRTIDEIEDTKSKGK